MHCQQKRLKKRSMALYSGVITLCVIITVVKSQEIPSQTCPIENPWVDIEPEAEVVVGALIDTHEQGGGVFGCGKPSAEGVHYYEALRWAVRTLNMDTGYLSGRPITESFIPGIKFGLRVYDSCSHKELAVRYMTELFPVLKSGNQACGTDDENATRIIGMIDATEHNNNPRISDAINEHLIPVIPLNQATTVPPEQLAKVLAEVVHDTDWEKVAILHADDEYSVFVTKVFGQIAFNGYPCIFGMKSIPSKIMDADGQTVRKIITSLTAKLPDRTGIIVIAHGEPLKDILRILEKVPQISRLQWLFSWLPPSQELSEAFRQAKLTQVFSLSPYPKRISDFDNYWARLQDLASIQNDQDRWFLEYAMFRKNCRVAGYPGRHVVLCENLVVKEPPVEELLRTSRFLPSFHAVFTFAHAYKKAWSEKCLGMSGVCLALRMMTRREFVERYLEPLEFDHQPESRSPVEVKGQKTNVSVRGEMDGLQIALNAYTFSQSHGLNFKQVFAYDSREAKVLDENFRYLASTCPLGGCKSCISVRQSRLDESDNDISPSEDFVTIARPEDILIPILLPLHQSGNNPMECGNILNADQVQNLEAALWTLDQINSDPEYLPGVRLGAVAIDSCSSPLTLTQRLSGFLVEMQKKNPDEFTFSIAVLSAGGSEEFSAAATVLSSLNITLIATTDVIRAETMKNTYLQTAIPVESKLEALTQTLKYLGWTFVSVVYDLDIHSRDQLKIFKKYATDADICLASELAVPSLDQVEVDYVTAQVIQAKNRGAKAVVLFTNEIVASVLMESLKKAFKAGAVADSDFVIICNGEWVNSFNSYKGFKNQTVGALMFKPEQGEVKDFATFYQRLQPDENKRNPWFVELRNNAKQHMRSPTSTLYTASTSTVNIIQAVLGISAGLARLRNDLCHPESGLCPRIYQQPHIRDLFHKYMRETASSKLDAAGKMFSFSKEGYGNIPVDIYSYKRNPVNAFSYQKVATFQNYTPNILGNTIYNVIGEELALDDVTSECIHACSNCGKRSTDFLVVDSPDELYLAAAMGVHESSSDRLSCGTILPSPGIQSVEAFLWAVDQINTSPQLLPGVKLGALVFDTCNSKERAARDVSNFLSDSLTTINGASGLPTIRNVLGFVATQSDDVIESIVDVTMPSKLLTLATDATSSKFNDVKKYSALFRTTLPNDIMAEGLVDILKHFKWSFVSVVYSEDDGSKADLFNVFKTEAERKNIELALVETMSSETTAAGATMRSLLRKIDAMKDQGSNVVVLLLNSGHLATLFATIQKQRDLGTTSGKDLVWIGVDNLEIFHKYPEVSLGAIMLRQRTNSVAPFKLHFENLNIQNNTRNPWFREFWEQALHCRGASCYKENNLPKTPFLQHSSVPDVINSVLSLGVALESMRSGLCPGLERGLCRALKEEPNFREVLLNVSRSVSFMGVEGRLFKFTSRNYAAGTLEIYNFIQVGNNARAFVEVGKFSPDEGLSLNYSKVKAYDRHGREFSLYDVESACNNSETCQKIPNQEQISTMQIVPRQEFAISAMMPIHHNGKTFFECGELKDGETFQNLAAVSYAVNKINSNNNLLPGVDLGAVVFDYCGRKQRAEEQMYAFFSKNTLAHNQKQPRVTSNSVIATLTYGEDVAMSLQPILEASNVVQIAAPADKMDFDDNNNLIHTVPPSMVQIQVLLSVLKRFKWRYINVIHSNTEFGRSAHYQFAKGAKQAEICLASVLKLDVDSSVDVIASKLRDNLEKREANVVVLLIDDIQLINTTMEAAKTSLVLHKFIWISSESWGTNDQLAQQLRTDMADVMTIKMETRDEPEFMEYFVDMTPRKHEPIPDAWFDEFWQRKFQCRLQDSSAPQTQFTSLCTGQERLSIEDIRQDKYVYHTIKVIEAVARGLHKYLIEKCPYGMSAMTIDDCGTTSRKELLIEIEKILSSKDPECEECGPYGTMFGYEVFQLRSKEDDMLYSKVGKWKDGKLSIDEDQIRFTYGTVPRSVCRTQCEKCSSQLGRPETLVDNRESIYDNFKEVWGITVSALSVLGMVLVIICALYFLMSFPVTVGTTVLGYMILFGLVLLYAVNFAFIIAPTEGTCGVRRFGLGLAYAVIFSGMLVKVMNTWRLMGYNGSRMLNDGTRLSSPAGLLVIAVGLVIIQIVLSAAWLILMPPKIGAYEMVWRCAPPTTFEEGLVVSLVYVMLLLAITTLFAIMTWQCQDNNKESRWILACSTMVAVVWLAWTVLSTQISPHHRDLTIAAANLVNATIIMVCLYLRKVYLYGKLTRQAKDQDLKAHLQPSSYPHSLYGTSQKSGPFSTLAPVLYGSQASLNGKKLYNGPSSRLELINCPEDNKSDSSGSVQVQAADLYPLDMYDGGSQFQPVSSLFGSNHTLVLDDTLTFSR